MNQGVNVIMNISQIKQPEISTNELFIRLSVLYQTFTKNKDEDNAEKVIQLLQKVKNKEYTLGFCGHFSAGKSSMMNQLMKEDVLPSSPIPTSANVVKVLKGRPYARVFYKDTDPIEFPAPYDYEVVKNYCKDGDAITSIEISREDINLPDGIAIMDTPGIDSTDDAHRVSTESMLHLADLILYVMDYNHVQSEQNFMFTKTLKERNKPVYLVVNQIDKHNDEELSFSSFKNSVEQSFKDWGVKVDGVFYTSLFDQSHPHNQLQDLEAFLSKKMDNRDELLKESVIKASEQLIKDHETFLQKQSQDEVDKYESILSHLSEEDKNNVFKEITSIEEQLEKIEVQKSTFRSQFESGIQKVLDNAYMMPASTRELARDFVESCQSNFKVGLFFAKQKTEQERSMRLQKFYEDLSTQVEAQVDWHVKDFIVKFVKSYSIQDEGFISGLYDLHVDFNPELLERTVKKGAGLTGDYVLNYTNDVANEVKRLYREAAREKITAAYELLNSALEAKKAELNEELKKYAHLKEALSAIKEIQKEGQEIEKSLLRILLDGRYSSEQEAKGQALLKEILKEETHVLKQVMEMSKQVGKKEESKVKRKESAVSKSPKKTEQQFEDRSLQTIKHLQDTHDLLKDVKGLKTAARDMAEKAKRLEKRSFTVALFGAFSAGKSSFANALMGANVLPVSPNPTTATINKIAPPDETNAHGTVRVLLKSEQDLLKDLSGSLQVFGKSCSSIQDALLMIESITYDGDNVKEKPHYSFLKAVKSGFATIKEHIGNEIIVDMETFKEYVANEEKACFVDSIQLFYDCPVTAQGITLVDTPGADSINARHTGVAFEYIKNADAILFVTYYNHAFSKADREFLIQLGRVKETFEMDKMFFIVNAADLAKSKEELNTVVDYVDEQLLTYGIRETRIYPLSSKLALKAKVDQDEASLTESGISSFENDFNTYILDELTQVAIDAANEEIKYALQTLEGLIENAKQSDDEKHEKLLEAQKENDTILGAFERIEIKSEERAIIQEIDELIFYVKQRVFLRYNDMFTEAFNPSSLREDGRDIKRALQDCLDELVQSIGFDLSQEMRATALRVEKVVNMSLKNIHDRLLELSKAENEHIHLIPFENRRFQSIDFEIALKDLDRKHFKAALSLFKNAKAFFEQGMKAKMREEIRKQLDQPVDHYLEQENNRINTAYLDAFSFFVKEIKEEASEEVKEYYEGIYSVLKEKIDITQMEESARTIETFIKK